TRGSGCARVAVPVQFGGACAVRRLRGTRPVGWTHPGTRPGGRVARAVRVDRIRGATLLRCRRVDGQAVCLRWWGAFARVDADIRRRPGAVDRVARRPGSRYAWCGAGRCARAGAPG